MSHTPQTDRELADLINRWQLGDLDEDARIRLTARLEDEPDARRAFIDAAKLEAMLHIEFPDSVVHIPRQRVAWFRQPSVWLAAAAALVMFGGIASMMRNAGPVPESPNQTAETSQPGERSQGTQFIESTPIARVTSMNGASFDAGSMKVVDGGLLPPGTIELKSGKLELTFFSGARVSIEGPSLFQLKSDFRATLVQGRITADVPPQAIGFTIYTPSGQLRDLGTAFAVSVSDSGDADVHVLDGKIEAAPRGGNSFVTLSGNQASRLSRGKLTPIAFLADGWPARPDSQETRGFPGSVHWSFDRFQVDETLDSSGVHPLWLRSSAADRPDASARLQRGMRGQALTFNGVDEYAESTYRGVSGNQARSVALWVRIPPEASHAYPNGIVSWGTYEQSRKWQVCWNNGDQGTVGALRVEFGDGYLIGTTDLRDGLWHHLSVVFLGGDGSDVASHVKLYVNGRLETLSGRKSQFIRTDTESPQAIAVTLGRWLGNWPGKEPFLYHGALDEVFIFEDALTPAQVARLAGDGTP
jgi:hypothetical protein